MRRMMRHMLAIRSPGSTNRYGFEPLETPAFEYTDALGKFLPDTDRPNEGVFSLQDEDEQWMSLRYDMTAPLARHVAENYQDSSPSRSGATRRGRCGATRSRGRAGSASSCSSMPIRSAPTTSPPTRDLYAGGRHHGAARVQARRVC